MINFTKIHLAGAPGDEDWRKGLDAVVAERMRFIAANEEKLVEAWIAETGFLPSESVIVRSDGPTGTRMWMERKTPKEQSFAFGEKTRYSSRVTPPKPVGALAKIKRLAAACGLPIATKHRR